MPHAAELAPRLLGGLCDPPPRPLAIRGRTGTGKTTLLRSVVRKSGCDVVWGTAVELVGQLAEAIRSDRYEDYRAALVDDGRPLCIEHLEDLRRKPVTRHEVRQLLESRAARGHPVLLTLTSARGDAEVVEWLESWAELLLLE
jgi:chromosomal replication initiation ATPase DnaA